MVVCLGSHNGFNTYSTCLQLLQFDLVFFFFFYKSAATIRWQGLTVDPVDGRV